MNSSSNALLSFFVFLALASTSTAFQTSTVRVSVDSTGAQGNNGCGDISISADGRFTGFASDSSNLVAGDTNGFVDIFVHDRVTGTTERVSVSTGGAQGDLDSDRLSISADGRFVAFRSLATNLVAGDTNLSFDIFVRDRTSGTTERVSVSTGGTEGNVDCDHLAISADGRVVAFESLASNLVAGDTNVKEDVFVHDRTSGITERVSVATGGAQGNFASSLPSISGDGRFVTFRSSASNLVAGDANSQTDIFVRDRAAGTTALVSVDSAGAQGDNACLDASISADGHRVAFASLSSNLVAGDANGVADVFVHDLTSGTTECVSVDSSGTQGNLTSDRASISADGRFVAFESKATNLVAGDTNVAIDIFVHDRASGTTERVSVDSSGAEANASSFAPAMSADTRFVAFQSFASNLVAGDTNGIVDIFLRDRGALPPSAYCVSSTSSSGCTASISASANPSVSFANPCDITVTRVEGLKSGILFYGIDNTGFTPGPWAQGSTSLLCVKAPAQRTPLQSSGGTFGACNGSLVLDWNAYQSTHPLALGNPWSIVSKVYVQAWFRDPPAVKSTNLSNAVEMTYGP